MFQALQSNELLIANETKVKVLQKCVIKWCFDGASIDCKIQLLLNHPMMVQCKESNKEEKKPSKELCQYRLSG